jgi:hypothetical protein
MTYVTNPYRFGAPFVPAWTLTGVTAGTANGGNMTVTLPSGAANDLLIGCLTWRGTQAITLPAGWTLISQTVTGDTTTGSRTSVLMAWKVRGGSEPNPQFLRTGGSWMLGNVLGFTSALGVPAFDVFTTQELAVAGTTITVPSLTPTVPRSLILAFAGLADFDGFTSLHTGFSAASMAAGPAAAIAFDRTGAAWGQMFYNAITPGAVVVSGLGYAVAEAPASATGILSGPVLTSSRINAIAAAFRPSP